MPNKPRILIVENSPLIRKTMRKLLAPLQAEIEEALQIIEDVKGTQLCPDCTALFQTWIRSREGHALSAT